MAMKELFEVHTSEILANVEYMKELGHRKGQYFWEKLTAEDGDLLGYVVADNEASYPNGGEQDGYWYRRATQGTEYGIFAETVNTSGYPLICKIKLPKVYNYMFYDNSEVTYDFLLHKVTHLDIEAASIGTSAFNGYFLNLDTSPKIKLKVGSIAGLAFKELGAGGSRSPKIWLSATCTKITASTITNYDTTTSPFHGVSSKTKFYCEATSKPSGWGASWNKYDGTTALTTTWGVTEEQFDAL